LILIIAIICLVSIFVGAAINQLLQHKEVPSSGVIATGDLGIYWNMDCSVEVVDIYWGTLEPGSSIPKTLYFRHEGTVDFTMSFNTTNWEPVNADQFIYITWNYDGTFLIPDEVREVIFTITANTTISGITNFSNLINIYTFI